MDCISQNTHKARKEYRCHFCNGIIKKGDVYERTVMKDDDIYSLECHLSCSKLANKIIDDIDDMHYDGFVQAIDKKWSDINGFDQVKILLNKLEYKPDKEVEILKNTCNDIKCYFCDCIIKKNSEVKNWSVHIECFNLIENFCDDQPVFDSYCFYELINELFCRLSVFEQVQIIDNHFYSHGGKDEN